MPLMATQTRALTEADALTRARIPGLKAHLTDRRLRRLAHGRKEFFHRTKNGVYDPITYFHVVDGLLNFDQQPFHTRDFVAYLRQTRLQLVWDVTSVGRILNDIAEQLEEANGAKYFTATRRYDGTIYAVQETLEAKAAIWALLEDLYILSENMVKLEVEGQMPPRLNSPLNQCPSLNPSIRVARLSQRKTVAQR